MDKYGRKNFKAWIKIKRDIHYSARMRSIKEGEIWWSSIGENVGVEICGKGKTFTRPVIIFKKMGNKSFWAIPLTSQPHEGSWYVPFDFNERKEVAVLAQIQCMSVSRLRRKMGQMSKGDFEKVRVGFARLLLGNEQKIRPRRFWGRAGISRKYISIVSKIFKKSRT